MWDLFSIYKADNEKNYPTHLGRCFKEQVKLSVKKHTNVTCFSLSCGLSPSWKPLVFLHKALAAEQGLEKVFLIPALTTCTVASSHFPYRARWHDTLLQTLTVTRDRLLLCHMGGSGVPRALTVTNRCDKYSPLPVHAEEVMRHVYCSPLPGIFSPLSGKFAFYK